jgi:hypothetical protein
MSPQLRGIVQNDLTSRIAPSTAPAGSGREGGFVGNEPPISPAEFVAVLRQEVSPFKPNGWELDSVEVEDLIAIAQHIYTNYWVGWVTVPLAQDAPLSVVQWQAKVKANG